MAKMFVNYSKTKAEFIAAGLESQYTNKIVFIGNGECVYTHGKYFGNVEEALATLKYFSAIKVGDVTASAAGRDGVITFAAADPQTVTIDVTNKGLTFGLSEAFKNTVSNAAVKADVDAAIEALGKVDAGYKTRIEAIELALGMGEGGGEGEDDPSVTAQLASLANRIGEEESARALADQGLEALIGQKVAQTDYNQMVEDLNAAIDLKVAQADYDAKIAELEKADTDNLNEAKSHATGLNTAMNTRMEAVEGSIETLTSGEAVEGSVDYKVKEAIDAFAAKVSDNGTIDTFKELVDYAAENGATVGSLVSDNNTNKQNIASNTTAIGQNKAAIEKEVEDREAAIETLSGTVSSNHTAAMGAAQAASSAASVADGKAVAAQSKADANETLLTKLDGADTVEGSIKKQIKDAVEAEAALRISADNTLTTEVGKKVAQTAYDTKMGQLDEAIAAKVAQSAYDTKMGELDAAIAAKVAQGAYDTKMSSLDTAIADLVEDLGEEISRAKLAEGGNSTAISNEVTRAQQAESGLRTDLGNKTDNAAADGSAFARIAKLAEDLNSLSGGAGSVADQIDNKLTTFKTNEVDPVSAIATANQGKLNTLTANAETSGSIDYKDAQVLASAKTYAEEKASAAQSAAESTAASALSAKAAELSAIDAGLRTDVDAANAAIAVLNGTAAGSVSKQISDAINTFATQVTGDNSTIDTFAEIVDYISKHGGEFGGVVTRLGNVETKAGANETLLNTVNGAATVEGSFRKAVADEKSAREAADATLQQGIDGVSAVANAAATKTALAEEASTARAAEKAAQDAADAAQELADANAAAIQAMNLSQVSGYIKSVSQANGKVSATKVDSIPAADITVADADGKIEASTVEAALAELADMWLWEEL